LPEDIAEDVYFPNSGMVSIVSTTEDGSAVEICMVGNEGLVGIPAILGIDAAPYFSKVQIPGDAIKMKASVLRNEFNKGGSVQYMLLRYIFLLISQFSQSAVCNRFHTVEKRLCRWLLIAHDRVKVDEFKLTLESISQMMGMHRPNLSAVAGALQRAGLISYQRGKLIILDRKGLEATSCECYKVVKDKFDQFLTA
jgi:CRP-like cAMP-binding protein